MRTEEVRDYWFGNLTETEKWLLLNALLLDLKLDAEKKKMLAKMYEVSE